MNMLSVYKYRNRWSYGRIKGILDTSGRKFNIIGRKQGLCRIRCAADVKKFYKLHAAEDYIPLDSFIKTKICLNNPGPLATSLSLTKWAAQESKYLAQLIKNSTGIKQMWVERHSIVKRSIDYRNVKHSAFGSIVRSHH
jgi:hypothetical protein